MTKKNNKFDKKKNKQNSCEKVKIKGRKPQ